MHADAHTHRPFARGTAHLVVLAHHPDNGQRGPYGGIGMILLALQAAPYRHHGVADVLVDHAVLALDAGAEQREVMVEQLGRVLFGQVFGLRGKFDDVGEHHGNGASARGHCILAELHQAAHQAAP